MPRVAVENSRMSLRIRAEEKTLLLRAVALEHTDLTDFVVKHALRAAKNVIPAAISRSAWATVLGLVPALRRSKWSSSSPDEGGRYPIPGPL